jgi:hypothetical protein
VIGSLIGGVITSVANNAIGKVADAFSAYQNKQISIAELEAKVRQAQLDAFTNIQKSGDEAIVKTYESFMGAVKGSKTLQIMYATALGSQIFVLFWSQWVVPMAHWLGYTGAWKAGTSAEWAYLLVGALCGLGPMVLRSGPGAGNIADQIKALGKK